MSQSRGKRDTFWAVEWHSKTRLDGTQIHLVWDGEIHLYRTRRDARAFIEERYGYIRRRADLRVEPYGWQLPRAVRVVVKRERSRR